MIDEREQGGASTEEFHSHEPQNSSSSESHRTEHGHGGHHERKRFDRGPRRDGRGRGDDRRGGRQERRPGRYRPSGEGSFERTEDDPRITALIHETEQKLTDSTQPVALPNLNAFERKQVHRYFDRLKPAFETKTYRGDDEVHVLWVFPVANLKKFAEAQAKQAVDTDNAVALPPMGSYERFIVHNVLKEIDSIESYSEGEGAERHICIQPKKFGRGLKKIIKKIKLM
ncbi:MAG: hypothetical protein ALAOOOJD_02750 [bacterium]|nr:hypothetical protein [bacterium]